ncbi:J domain-containing protein required for chloroplast accumulation response 1 isoform X2 [Helianthus annuus]|uniref:J domain-containing protein required for chloroplast accumulation response 1 isoform X2 n=1 Tax=Helianthus annuus TaxID=4232 RepID=UPI000B8F04B2|nr:J domain-containing protein required for chloroplast accumulation response 1 isoform X2 [Helianthus annuus]
MDSDSDINFDDVFGGPPMWTRYTYGGGSQMKSWEETMVFGEPNDHDVFRTSTDESVRWSSPSLPTKMTKAVDTPVFGSSVHTQNNHPYRFSSPSTQILRNNSCRSAGQTLLTRESSSKEWLFKNKKSSKESVYSTRSTDDHKSKARTGSSGIDFHFSMHKWANVGVPSLMSLHQGTHPGSSKVSVLSIDNMQNSGFPNKDLYAEKQQVKSSLLHDEFERKGYEEAGTKKKMSSSNKAEGVGSPKNQVKVMLKDLFKMPNHESPPKTKTKTKTKVSSSIWKTGAKKRIQEEVTDIISNLDTNVEMMTDAFKTTSFACDLPVECVKMAQDASVTLPLDSRVPDDSFMVKEEIKRSKKQKFAQNRTIRTLDDIDFQKNASPTSDSIPKGSQASVETIDDLSFDNFQVEELEPVASEAIMALDSKIHMWSSGRTGNIRSLLSTLHFVLWAESGWKPVALVDIIEANALKKSYNRAMLCLHPDKLQQKGIDSHKKYIAEKVLDILQAWDHLN